jgi:hypothetical protein
MAVAAKPASLIAVYRHFCLLLTTQKSGLVKANTRNRNLPEVQFLLNV